MFQDFEISLAPAARWMKFSVDYTAPLARKVDGVLGLEVSATAATSRVRWGLRRSLASWRSFKGARRAHSDAGQCVAQRRRPAQLPKFGGA